MLKIFVISVFTLVLVGGADAVWEGRSSVGVFQKVLQPKKLSRQIELPVHTAPQSDLAE